MKNFFSKLVRVAMLTVLLSAIGRKACGTVFYQGRVFGAGGVGVSGANVRVQGEMEVFFNFGFGWNYIGNQSFDANAGTDGTGVWTFIIGDGGQYEYRNPRANIAT